MHASTSPYPHRPTARGGLAMLLLGGAGAVALTQSSSAWTGPGAAILAALALTGLYVLATALRAARSNGELA